MGRIELGMPTAQITLAKSDELCCIRQPPGEEAKPLEYGAISEQQRILDELVIVAVASA